MSSFRTPVTEEDLHALVDWELDPSRRDQVATALATSPADHAKVEAWRQQNILLRAAFAPVEHEAIPLGLAFAPPAQAIAARATSAKVPAAHATEGPRSMPNGMRNVWLLLAAGLALGLGLSYSEPLLFDLPLQFPPVAAAHHDHDPNIDIDVRSVAPRITQALDRFLPPATEFATTTNLRRHVSNRVQVPDLQSPDLTAIGMRLTGAAVMAWDRGPLACFDFIDASEDRLVLCLGRLPRPSTIALQNIGTQSAAVIGWQDATIFYALSGPSDADQLSTAARRIRAALPVATNENR